MFHDNLGRRLYFQAAVCRFASCKRAGFTKLVDRRTTSTKNEILTILLTQSNSMLHFCVDLLKCWMDEHILQMILSNIAKKKVCIPWMTQREQFGRESRDIAVTIKTDDCQRRICLRVRLMLQGFDMLDQSVYLAYDEWVLTRLPQYKDALKKSAVALSVVLSAERYVLRRS